MVKILGQYSWYVDNSNIKDGDPAYRRVGTLKPNPWGLYDMHGNVANWVIDAYDAKWYAKFAGKTSNWHDMINWPSKQYPRVFRGGSYELEAEDCRSAARHHSSKDMNIKDPQLPQSPHWLTEGFSLGIRVVAPVKEPAEAEKIRYWDVDDEYTANILGKRNQRHPRSAAAAREEIMTKSITLTNHLIPFTRNLQMTEPTPSTRRNFIKTTAATAAAVTAANSFIARSAMPPAMRRSRSPSSGAAVAEAAPPDRPSAPRKGRSS